MIISRLLLPKELNKEEEKKTFKDFIAPIETFYGNLGEIKAKKSFWRRDDYLALEIVCEKDNLITFYLVYPDNLKRFIERQLHAQFPLAELEEVEDYNIFLPHGTVLGADLTLNRQDFFPLKTYVEMESDPMSALASALTKFKGREGGAIQILIRPAWQKWHLSGAKIASQIQQGKKLNEAILSISGNKFIKGLKELFAAASKKKAAEKEKEKQFNRLSLSEENIVKNIERKISKMGLEVSIRIIVSAGSKEMAQRDLNGVINSFTQFNARETGNGFKIKIPKNQNNLIHRFIFRKFDKNKKFILNTEELAGLYHPPSSFLEIPNIRWLFFRKSPPPVNLPLEGLILGKNIYQGIETTVRIKRDDRRRHAYIIGMTGTGKSVLMANMAIQDIKNGEGVCVIEPHGDLIEDILRRIPKERMEDVIVFNPSDTEMPVGLNMLEAKTSAEGDFAVQEMIAIWQKMFPPEILGPIFEHNMRNNLLTLMADKDNIGTLVDIPRLFTDAEFQKFKLQKVKDPQVRLYWEKEIAKTSDFHKSEMYGYIISKVGRFAENEMIRNIIGQAKSGFNFRQIMDEKKILLVNLSKGKTGEVNSNLLGLIIVAKLQMAALSRADLPLEQRTDFYLYIDEFHNFITENIATILSEARKYRLNLTVAHQYLKQLICGQDTKIRDAVLGTVGTMISFKIGVDDAEVLAKEFKPVFSEYDLVNIEKYNACVKMLIDNQPVKAFNIATFNLEKGDENIAQKIKELSRLKYGRSRDEVEKNFLQHYKLN